ncbi:hypothetical protein [Dysgonomonas sp. 511]|uniref:hypothetical protein n=1 Tax=Dysgonomonas sp. 511 TaxID=2302930 RepID=UPI0013D46AB5|nr:hypothetical protein [Dysgonomonas sp. 511]NDV78448.1 hypothetical protein [Dysgonomonas sp. 511]
MHKTITITLILLSAMCEIQAQTYNLFHKDQKNILISLDVAANRKELVMSSQNQEKRKFELVPASDDIYIINKEDSCAIMKFVYDDRMIEFIIDTTFANIESARLFAAEPVNMVKQLAVYLLKDITLEQLRNLPYEDEMSDEDEQFMEKIEEEQIAELKLFGYSEDKNFDFLKSASKIDIQSIVKITLRQAMLNQALTYMLGYKSKIE